MGGMGGTVYQRRRAKEKEQVGEQGGVRQVWWAAGDDIGDEPTFIPHACPSHGRCYARCCRWEARCTLNCELQRIIIACRASASW